MKCIQVYKSWVFSSVAHLIELELESARSSFAIMSYVACLKLVSTICFC